MHLLLLSTYLKKFKYKKYFYPNIKNCFIVYFQMFLKTLYKKYLKYVIQSDF